MISYPSGGVAKQVVTRDMAVLLSLNLQFMQERLN